MIMKKSLFLKETDLYPSFGREINSVEVINIFGKIFVECKPTFVYVIVFLI